VNNNVCGKNELRMNAKVMLLVQCETSAKLMNN